MRRSKYKSRPKSRPISKQKSRQKRRTKSKQKSRPKSKPKSRQDYPLCPDSIYCGGKDGIPTVDYDRAGRKEECFKKGMGVGMGVQLQIVKSKLAEKGITLVTRKIQRSPCRRRDGTILR